MDRSKYLLKNMGILTISNFSSKLLVFLLVPLYTSVLTKAEYGTYDLAISTATLFYPILSLNVVDAVMRFSMDKECDRRCIVSIGLKFLSISIIVFGIGMYLLNITKLWPDIQGLELYIFLYYVTYVLNQFLIQYAKGIEHVKDMAIAGVISTLVMVLTNILFLLVFKMGLIGFFLANLIALLISGLFLIFRLKICKIIDLRHTDRQLQKEMLIYSVPLIATIVGWWVNSTADKYIVTFFLGISANGLLSASYKIPQIINVLQGIFTQTWQISAIKEYGEEGTAEFYGDTFNIINLLMCATGSWLIVLNRLIAKLLYAEAFYEAWQFTPFLLISCIVNCASGLLGPILAAQKKSKAMMWSAVIGAGSNVVLNIILVKYIGIQGATVATLICSCVIYIIRKISVGRKIKIEHYEIVIITWMVLCVQAIVEIYYMSYVIESVIMVILLMLNIKNIKKLISFGQRIVFDNKKREKK